MAWDGVEGLTAVTTEPGIHEVVASVDGCQTALQVDVLFQAIPEVSFALQGEAVVGPLEVCSGEPLTSKRWPQRGSPAWKWELSVPERDKLRRLHRLGLHQRV